MHLFVHGLEDFGLDKCLPFAESTLRGKTMPNLVAMVQGVGPALIVGTVLFG